MKDSNFSDYLVYTYVPFLSLVFFAFCFWPRVCLDAHLGSVEKGTVEGDGRGMGG